MRLAFAVLAWLLVSEGHLAAAKIASYRELPWGACRFAEQEFGFIGDKWQEQTLVAFADPAIPRISLQACAGPGKTAVEAICGWYFLATRCTPGEHPKGLCTSVTGENLRDNLWAEFSKWQQRSSYLMHAFRWTAQRIFSIDHPETWFFSPRKWPKTGNADEQGATFSGLHSQNVCVIVDESGAIPPTVLRAAEQALANTTFGKILQGGNPISLEGMLYAAANQLREQWFIVRVTGDPDDPNRSPRIDIDWARKQIATYGRDNPWVMSYILGQFPPSSLNSLLGIEDVHKAIARSRLDHTLFQHMQKRIGVDVARFGDDRTVLFPRQGLQAFNPIVMRGANTNEIVARVMESKRKWGSELELIDNSFAWGNGVVDNLTVAGVSAHAVNFAGKAIDPRYRNRRAEGWIKMADAIKAGAALPNEASLVAELTTPTYTFHNGQFQLEEKDQVKKRLGRSPDLADALALTYTLPDLPGQLLGHMSQAGLGRAVTEYDPFAGGSGRTVTDYDPYSRPS